MVNVYMDHPPVHYFSLFCFWFTVVDTLAVKCDKEKCKSSWLRGAIKSKLHTQKKEQKCKHNYALLAHVALRVKVPLILCYDLKRTESQSGRQPFKHTVIGVVDVLDHSICFASLAVCSTASLSWAYCCQPYCYVPWKNRLYWLCCRSVPVVTVKISANNIHVHTHTDTDLWP